MNILICEPDGLEILAMSLATKKQKNQNKQVKP